MARTRISAGLLIYRHRDRKLQVLLVHPSVPHSLHRSKDAGAWTIPKGEGEVGESLLTAAKRALREETGLRPLDPFPSLHPIQQRGSKAVHAWAFAGDCNPATLVCNRCTKP